MRKTERMKQARRDRHPLSTQPEEAEEPAKKPRHTVDPELTAVTMSNETPPLPPLPVDLINGTHPKEEAPAKAKREPKAPKQPKNPRGKAAK